MSDAISSRQSHRRSADELPPFPASAWRGVFAEYFRIMDPISECPGAYHFPNLLAIIAAELGPDLCFDEGTDPRLNFYILSCGESGTKKTTATDLARIYIAANLPTPGHARITSVSSGEGLIRTLIQHPNLYLACDEIKDLFVVTGRTGSRIEGFLNSAFNQSTLQGNIKSARDSQSISEYYLNVLVNGTPEHIRTDCSESLFKGGLLNRFLAFAAEPTDKNLPIMGQPDRTAVAQLAVRIGAQCAAWRALGLGPGTLRVRMSAAATARFTDWYVAWNRAQKGRIELESHPLKRLDTHAKKLASVYAVLETPASDAGAEITDDQMAAALDVINFCQQCMSWLAYKWTGQRAMIQQADAIAEQRAIAYLSTHGCVPEATLYAAMQLSHNEFMRTLAALQHHEYSIVSTTSPRVIHYKPSCTHYGPIADPVA